MLAFVKFVSVDRLSRKVSSNHIAGNGNCLCGGIVVTSKLTKDEIYRWKMHATIGDRYNDCESILVRHAHTAIVTLLRKVTCNKLRLNAKYDSFCMYITFRTSKACSVFQARSYLQLATWQQHATPHRAKRMKTVINH